jgi:dihydrofolate synthase / folylpolyglutamate synthase
LLKGQGFSVGHIVSPHIHSINERFQIDCKPIKSSKLLGFANEIFATENNLNPFEKITALQFYIFSREKPDYVILETGIGGRLDPTNVAVKHKICILNAIGLDHTEYLGTTLAEIAYEKAGIIEQNSQVIALSQSEEINKVFVDTVSAKNAKISFIEYEKHIQNVIQNTSFLSFDYINLQDIKGTFSLSLMGKYQAGNASLSIRAMEFVASEYGWKIEWNLVKENLKSIVFTGRFEVIKSSQSSISVIDGAHNPQKMQAFLSSLISAFPLKKFTLVLAIKNGKDSEGVLQIIAKYSMQIESIILTTFSGIEGLGLSSITTESMKVDLIKCGYSKPIIKTKSLQEVFEIIETTNQNYIFTGSLYIIGTIRSNFGLVQYTSRL